MLATHLDGMSSDEETSDRYQELFQTELGWLNILVLFYPNLIFFSLKNNLLKRVRKSWMMLLMNLVKLK